MRRSCVRALAVLLVLAVAPVAKAQDRDWVRSALDLQYELASDVGLRNAPWVYTHNAFNSRAEVGPTLSSSDSNQQISIVDQLEEGVRHLEIDVHLFPTLADPQIGLSGPVVCHATSHVGCTLEPPLGVVLARIDRWLATHPRQVVMLYIESHLDHENGYGAGAKVLDGVLGPRLYKPPGAGARCVPLPLELTRDAIRAAGKQVLVMGPCGTGRAWPALVYDEDPRITGDDNSALREFPDCGPDFTRAEYQRSPIRYYEDSTGLTRLTKGGQSDPVTAAIAARMTRCGVDLIGFDQLLHGDPRLAALIWSWGPGEPRAGDCSVQRADGRWEVRPCGERHRVACRGTDGSWRVPARPVRARTAPRMCAAGEVNAVPRTGYEGQLLKLTAARSGGGAAWLGQRRSGRGWEPFERASCGPTLKRAKRRQPVRGGIARVVVRLRFACTGEELRRKIAVRGGLGPVRARTGRRIAVPVRAGRRTLRVSFRYRGRRRSLRVRLRQIG